MSQNVATETNGENELLTEVEVAKWLRVTPNCVRDWRLAGTIPSIRMGNKLIRFRKADVLASFQSGARVKADGGHDRQLTALVAALEGLLDELRRDGARAFIGKV